MVERQDFRPDKPSPKGGLPGPFDGFAAATAVGFAMTAQALDMWFGVMSGVAKASQDIFEPKDKTEETEAYSASGKSATAKAKSATRTVVADIERAVQDVAEVAVDLLGGRTKGKVEAEPAATASAQAGDVIDFDATPAPSKRTEAAKSAEKRSGATKTVKVVPKAESKPAESVTAVSSPIESSRLETVTEAPSVQTSDESVESVAKTAIEESTAPSTPVTSMPAVGSPTASAIMPEDFRQPQASEKPHVPDDLKLIVGVGPKLERVLNGLGVWTFAQVAGWSPQETAWVDDYLGLSGRIARDGWVAQADGLAKGMKAAG
jgi:predicted flap endonuclease-1-like 5' DNA nuclease